jgi:hypothetical protein
MKRVSLMLLLLLTSTAVLIGFLTPWPISHSGSRPTSGAPLATPLERLQEGYLRFEASRKPLVESYVAQCMERRGFEYVPDSHTPARSAAQRLEPSEFKLRFGYGIVGPSLHPRQFEVATKADRNVLIRRALPPVQRQSYDRALYGGKADEVVVRAANGHALASFFPRSCITRAQQAFFGNQRILILATARLNLLLPILRRRIENDPRTISIVGRWSACMRARGYSFDNPGEARAYVQSLLMLAERRTELRRVARMELRLASVDGACQEEAGFASLAGVTAEYETALIMQHPGIIARVWPTPAGAR